MKNRALATVASVLVLMIVAPSAFLVAPQRAHADLPVIDFANVVQTTKTAIESTFTAVKSAITAASSVTSAAANYALMIDKYVFEPIAFVMSGNLLKSITAGVLDFVMGKTNGTGQPQFVTDLRGHLTSVSDAQAIAFFASFGKNSNSPFAAAITSSLRTNYYQQTSLAGFYAQNQCTLSKVSSNVNAFLAGNWSQGGAAAWMALTTQPQNNPYLLQERAQTELSVLTANAVSSRLTELSWGQGFLSWCSGGSNSSAVGQSCSDFANGSDCPGELVCVQGGTSGKGTCQVPTAAQSDAVSQATCVNKDGTPGTIQTPGSTIKGYLDKALGSNIDKLANLGSLASSVDGILGNVATVMQTLDYATQLFGGNGTGLSNSNYSNNGTYMGLSQSSVQTSGNTAVQGYTNQANTAANSAAGGAQSSAGTADGTAQSSASAAVAAAGGTGSTGAPLGPPPPAPTGLTATCNDAGTQVTLAWSPVSGADSYNVQSWQSGGAYNGQGNVADVAVTYPVTPGNTYNWSVASYSATTQAASDPTAGSSYSCAPTQAYLNSEYVAAWKTIGSAATNALNSLNTVVSSTCAAPYPGNASSAITNTVNPIIAKAANASTVTATAADVAQAQADAATVFSLSDVTSNSCQNFSVSGGSLNDQMQMLAKDAASATFGSCANPTLFCPP